MCTVQRIGLREYDKRMPAVKYQWIDPLCPQTPIKINYHHKPISFYLFVLTEYPSRPGVCTVQTLLQED